MKDMERWAKKQEKQSKSLQAPAEQEKEEEVADIVRPGMGLSFGFTQSVSLPKNPSLIGAGTGDGDLVVSRRLCPLHECVSLCVTVVLTAVCVTVVLTKVMCHLVSLLC